MNNIGSISTGWKSEILSQLDKAALEYQFPIFNNVNYPAAGMRLTAFRDDAEWLIVFEKVAYSDAEGTFLNMIYAYGNKLAKPGFQAQSVRRVVKEVPSDPIWDDEMNFLLDMSNFSLLINGSIRQFSPSEDIYNKAKINLNDDSDSALKVLRLIMYFIPDEVFSNDDELLAACNRANIPKFIQLNEWHHPDVLKGELPSHSVCFQTLAQAIAENKIELFSCPEEINTHWSCWEYI
jgi:hypothetical protein